MLDIIKLLPDSVANQIAAGEVVQRPSSVVKELVENAIDAGASNITIITKDAGKMLIQVVDDGKGMSETDARMCFERHATSKITKADDLFSIMTKGFRGEAMASIAAVAQVELKTKTAQNELGTRIKIEGSKLKEQESDSCPEGTSISVRNLFFNIPARRNFLKTNAVEMRHISDEFERTALAHPEITFELYHNDLPVHICPKGTLIQRIIDIFGKSYQNQLIKVDEETPDIKIHGYVGTPEFAKKSKGDQFFFVNNRFIKSAYLNHALSSAYGGLISKEHFPFYAIFLDLDPKTIDINVHPTKTEIKFEDERLIYAVLNSAIRKALGINNIGSSLDFESDTNFLSSKPLEMENSYNQTAVSKPFSNSGFKPEKPEENWQKMYENLELSVPNQAEMTQTITFSSGINQNNNSSLSTEYERQGSIIQVLGKYIISQVKSGMLIIDQHLAHERVLYEKFLKMLMKKYGSSQQFLFPQTIELSPQDHALVMELEAEIKSIGFVFNDFGKNTIVLNGIPSDAPSGNEKDLFEGLLQSYKYNQSEFKLDAKENLARSMAKRSAVKSGTKLSNEEQAKIIEQLFACETPEYTPDGKKTMNILKEEDIKRFL